MLGCDKVRIMCVNDGYQLHDANPKSLRKGNAIWTNFHPFKSWLALGYQATKKSSQFHCPFRCYFHFFCDSCQPSEIAPPKKKHHKLKLRESNLHEGVVGNNVWRKAVLLRSESGCIFVKLDCSDPYPRSPKIIKRIGFHHQSLLFW